MNKTYTIGFYTKDLGSLNQDLQENNQGILPENWQIVEITIKPSGSVLEVRAELIIYE